MLKTVDYSIVDYIVSFDLTDPGLQRFRHSFALVCRCGLADNR